MTVGAPARADPVMFHATLTADGNFDCRGGTACTGEGTNSITVGTGEDAVTLTFLGVDTSVSATVLASATVLSESEYNVTGGFARADEANPRQPLVHFRLTNDSLPVPAAAVSDWQFGAEGDLAVGSGNRFLIVPPGRGSSAEGALVFSLNAPLALGPNTRPSLAIDAAPVPEPATMVLLGTGLLGAAFRARRRKAA